MKTILLLSVLINVLFVYIIFVAPTGLTETEYRHTNTITWERDKATTALFFKLMETPTTRTNGLWIGNKDGGTIIANVPKNNYQLQVFGQECLHAFGYLHK